MGEYADERKHRKINPNERTHRKNNPFNILKPIKLIKIK